MINKKRELFRESGNTREALTEKQAKSKPQARSKSKVPEGPNPKRERGMFNTVESEQEKFLRKRQSRSPNATNKFGESPEKKRVELVEHPRIKDLRIENYSEKE